VVLRTPKTAATTKNKAEMLINVLGVAENVITDGSAVGILLNVIGRKLQPRLGSRYPLFYARSGPRLRRVRSPSIGEAHGPAASCSNKAQATPSICQTEENCQQSDAAWCAQSKGQKASRPSSVKMPPPGGASRCRTRSLNFGCASVI
jgi:hypothetical protein